MPVNNKQDIAKQYTYSRFPTTEGIDFTPLYDPNFIPSDIGPFGDIEYMQAQYDTLPYYNDYPKPDSLKGKSVIVYNDRLGDQNAINEAIALDAVTHGLREQDPTWKNTFLPEIEKAYGEDANYFADKQGLRGQQRNEFVDGFIDGKIRAMLVKDQYRQQFNYPSVEEVRQEMNTPEKYSAMLDAYNYVHPKELPGITVTAPRIKANGGSLNNWNNLSLSEKREYIKAAVRQGMWDLPSIKKAYNKFADGGDTQQSWTMPSYNMQQSIQIGKEVQ